METIELSIGASLKNALAIRLRGSTMGMYPIQSDAFEVPMPSYEYHCRKCGENFAVRERISNYGSTGATCPKCASTDVERVMSGFYARTPRKS